jgi:pSer/pThr/pTyr-binding forkhead associated (FHA) protein
MHRCSGQFVIVDLASVLGVFVNGIKVVKCILRNDDQIAIGDATLLYQQPCRYSTMF